MKKLDTVRVNSIKRAAREGWRSRGLRTMVPSPTVLEIVGMMDFDHVFLDAEHGRFDLADIEGCCRAAELSDLTVAARVPDGRRSIISHYLDRGVQNITVPHVRTKAQAEEAVEACFFRPMGTRAAAGERSDRFWHGIADHQKHFAESNANITLCLMFEDRESLDNMDEILSVPHVDFYKVGKNDLCQSLGYDRVTGVYPEEVNRIVADVDAAVRAKGGLMSDDAVIELNFRQMVMGAGEAFLRANPRATRCNWS